MATTEHSRVFAARYQGRCCSCGEPVGEGDLIQMVDGQSVHAECFDSVAEPERLEPPPCPVCWLAHPVGGCDR